MPEIFVNDFVSGAREARGVAIVIDVFRACTLIATALQLGARRIVPVAEIETARQLKQKHPDWLLVGERHAQPLPGFDLGNSPTDIAQLTLAGRTVIHTTHAGTQGIVAAASGASAVFTGALVNLTATARAVLALEPRVVTLCRMGHEARARCAEDDLCAELLTHCLKTMTARSQAAVVADVTTELVRSQLRGAPAAQKFFDPAATWAPEEDFWRCTAVDSIELAIAWQRAPDGLGVLRPLGAG
jgi:2-phosphosulfolactate phosphatase